MDKRITETECMSKIYFFGCSYTFGHGLSDCRLMIPSDAPSKIGWAGQVAKLAGKECMNLAEPGGSNRQAVHLAQTCDIQSGDIAIFHWTFMNRYFYIHKHPVNGILTTKVGNWMLKDTRNVRIRGHFHAWSEAHEMHDTEILVDYINARFEKNGIRCINFEPFIFKKRNQESWEDKYWNSDAIDCMTKFDNRNLLYWQNKVSKAIGKTDLADDNSHPGLKSNTRFAQYILEEYPWLKD